MFQAIGPQRAAMLICLGGGRCRQSTGHEDDIRREADAPPFENELAEIDKRGFGLDLVFDDHAQALAMFADGSFRLLRSAAVEQP